MPEAPEALLTAARSGDPASFAALIEGRWDGLVRLARSVVGEAEAEDVVQDGLVTAWKELWRLREPAAFPAWLTRVVLRRCLKRARFRRRFVPLALAPEPPDTRTPKADATIDLERLLARLAPRQRAVLHLTVVEEMSDAEIGAALGITAGSVRAHRRRARSRLDRILGGTPWKIPSGSLISKQP